MLWGELLSIHVKNEDPNVGVPSPWAATPLCPSCSSSFWISQSPPSSAASAVYAESSLPVRQTLLFIQVTVQQMFHFDILGFNKRSVVTCISCMSLPTFWTDDSLTFNSLDCSRSFFFMSTSWPSSSCSLFLRCSLSLKAGQTCHRTPGQNWSQAILRHTWLG